MVKFQFKSNEIEVKSGISKKGQPYSIREQTAYVQLGDEIRKVVVGLGKDAPVYAAGLYTMDDSSFTTDNFGNLAIGRLVLRALPKATA